MARRTARRAAPLAPLLPLLLLLLLALAAGPAAPRGAHALSLDGVKARLQPLAAQLRAALASAAAPSAAKQPAGDASGAAAAAEAFDSITAEHPEDAAARAGAGAASGGGGGSDASGGPWVPLIRTLSWSPRTMLWQAFLTEEEADHLLQLADHHLQKSDVVETDTGKIVSSKERTSSGYFLPGRRIDPIVKRLEERIARWTQIPLEHGEPFHILRYNPTEEYTPHFDYFFDSVHVQNGGQRLATVILYLSDVPSGGETVFPDSPTNTPAEERAGFSACAQRGLAVKPRKADALLFFSLKPDGTSHDVHSLHAGCPVVEGTKWIATKWIRVNPYHDWGDPEEGAEAGKAAAAAAAAQEAAGAQAAAAAAGDAGDAGAAAGGHSEL